MKRYNGKMTKGETCPFLAALAERRTGEQEPAQRGGGGGGTGWSLPWPRSSLVHPHPRVLSPRQPTSPTGTAASTCRCVSELCSQPCRSSSRAQNSRVASPLANLAELGSGAPLPCTKAASRHPRESLAPTSLQTAALCCGHLK